MLDNVTSVINAPALISLQEFIQLISPTPELTGRDEPLD